MLSRLIPRASAVLRSAAVNAVRNTSSVPAVSPLRPRDKYVEDWESFKMPGAPYEGMGPLPVMPMWDPKCMRHYVVPEYWFEFLYDRTGVTGPYALAAGTAAFLFSKEWYVYTPETWIIISLVTCSYFIMKYVGPDMRDAVHSMGDKYYDSIYRMKIDDIENMEAEVEDIKTEMWRSGLQELYHEVKKSNLAVMLETEFLNRKASLVSAVKKKLDYQVAVQQVDRDLAHAHLVKWVQERVAKSITPESQKQTLDVCIAQLNSMAPK